MIKAFTGILCTLALLTQMVLGAGVTVHANDCHTSPEVILELEVEETKSFCCCHGHHHEEPVEEQNSKDEQPAFKKHQPHCTCAPYTISQVNFPLRKQQNTDEVNTEVEESAEALDPQSYCAAAPSMAPPLEPDVGKHSSGGYASIVYGQFIA